GRPPGVRPRVQVPEGGYHPAVPPVVRGRVAEVPAGLVLPEGTVLVEPLKVYEPDGGVPAGDYGRTYFERVRITPGSLTIHVDVDGNRFEDAGLTRPMGQTIVYLRSGAG